jgi:hypothetical protein
MVCSIRPCVAKQAAFCLAAKAFADGAFGPQAAKPRTPMNTMMSASRFTVRSFAKVCVEGSCPHLPRNRFALYYAAPIRRLRLGGVVE